MDFQVISDLKNSRSLFLHCIHPKFGTDLFLCGYARPNLGSIPTMAELQVRDGFRFRSVTVYERFEVKDLKDLLEEENIHLCYRLCLEMTQRFYIFIVICPSPHTPTHTHPHTHTHWVQSRDRLMNYLANLGLHSRKICLADVPPVSKHASEPFLFIAGSKWPILLPAIVD